MLGNILNPVSCFRVNQVLNADQAIATHEFVVDHLLNCLQGQQFLINWHPTNDFTECQVLFPCNPDRVTHIRPIANYFMEHLNEDPAVLYHSRRELLDLLRMQDMARVVEAGGWGLTTMSRLNNVCGKGISMTRTRIVSPNDVVYKTITREFPFPFMSRNMVTPNFTNTVNGCEIDNSSCMSGTESAAMLGFCRRGNELPLSIGGSAPIGRAVATEFVSPLHAWQACNGPSLLNAGYINNIPNLGLGRIGQYGVPLENLGLNVALNPAQMVVHGCGQAVSQALGHQTTIQTTTQTQTQSQTTPVTKKVC